MMEGEHLSVAVIFRRVLVGVVVGTGMGYLMPLPGSLALTASVLLVGGWLLLRSPERWWLVMLAIGSLAWSWGAAHQPQRPVNIPDEEPVEFTGWISEAPLLEEGRARYVVTVEDKAWQRVLVRTRRHPVYNYGERLQISCSLRSEDFSYWVNRDVYASCSFPQITKLSGEQGSAIRRLLFSWRSDLSGRLARLLPEPQLSLVAGIIWGEQAGLPADLKEAFRRTGTTHILAVSGFNVTTLTAILFTLLVAGGLRRQWASLALVILITAFVIFTGAEASVIRAGIMGALVVLARLVGRAVKPWQLLLLAAAAMLALWPRLLVDLGWQLSFLAMAGLLYLSPLIKSRLHRFPEILGLRQVAADTLAATAATLPLILLRVDNLSLVSPLANLLIVPVVPWVMIGGLLLLGVSWLGSVALVIAWPVWLGLSYVQMVALALASLGWSYQPANGWLWLAVSLVYGGLGLALVKAQRRSDTNNSSLS